MKGSKKILPGLLLIGIAAFACSFSDKSRSHEESTSDSPKRPVTVQPVNLNAIPVGNVSAKSISGAKTATYINPKKVEPTDKKSINKNKSATPQQGTTPLKDVYRNYFPIGTAVNPTLLAKPGVAQFVSSQYSSITAINEMKPLKIQPQEGVFDWSGADKIVNFATQNNMKMRGHCLIWFYRMPKWFFWDNGQLVSKQKLYDRMNAHITAVMQRYKGRVYCYDVLNEIVPSKQGSNIYNTADTLYKIAGPEYIKKAFEFARKADPTAKLFYNDSFYDATKRDKIYTLVKGLKESGVPIDGVGVQCHFGINGMPEQLLSESIDMFAKLGLEVQITELDVSIFNKDASAKSLVGQDDSYTQSLQDKQADIFNMVFRVCRQKRNEVTGITMWAPADVNNYLTKLLGKRNYPNLFDKDLKPKPAMKRILNFN